MERFWAATCHVPPCFGGGRSTDLAAQASACVSNMSMRKVLPHMGQSPARFGRSRETEPSFIAPPCRRLSGKLVVTVTSSQLVSRALFKEQRLK